ncbi:MAG: BrnT family toxin [Schwartzia sp. (in: firmicutes)]
MEFEWDEAKNQLNQRKHGISFEEVQSVFEDVYAILFDDPDHSQEEDRFLMIGRSERKGICIVSHCYRGENERIRIISARKATKYERKFYESGLYH